MKISMAKCFLITLFICLSIEYASSIECYVCDSLKNKKCVDEYTGLKQKCVSGVTVCSIVKMEATELITRQCDVAREQTGGKNHGVEDTEVGKVSWSICRTDLCNWGVKNKSQMTTSFISAMLSLCFYYKL